MADHLVVVEPTMPRVEGLAFGDYDRRAGLDVLTGNQRESTVPKQVKILLQLQGHVRRTVKSKPVD